MGRAMGALHHEVHRGLEALQSLPQAPVVVRLADEPGLARVGLAEHAEVMQVRRQCFVESVIAGDPVAVVAGRLLAEKQAAHRRVTAEGMLDAALREDLAHAGPQLRAVFRDGGEGRGLRQDFERLLGRGEGDGMTGEGAAVHDPVAEVAHDVLAPAAHRDRVAVAHRLGEGTEVGLDAEQLLHAALGDAKAGLDLVDDEEDSVLVAERARLLEEFAGRRDRAAVAHDRLDHEGGDVVSVGLEHRLEPLDVVHRHGVDQRAQDVRDAGAVGHELRVAVARLPLLDGRVPERGVEHAVVAALDDDVGIPARVGARDPQCRHHGFGPGVGKTHQLGRRHHAGDPLGHGKFALRGEGEDAPDLDAGPGRGIHPRVAVTEDAGAVTQPVVDVLVAIDVGQACALGRLHVNRLGLAPVTEIRRNPEREPADGLLELGVGLREASGHAGGLLAVRERGLRGGLVSPKRAHGVHDE